MLDDQKRIMSDVWEEEQRRIQAEKTTLKDQVNIRIIYIKVFLLPD
jgi:hypothetical protein